MSRKQVGRYILDRRIGKGSYAHVWLGHCEDSDDKVAVKVISRHTVNETAQLRQEVAVLKRIEHANIVKFIDLKKSVGHYYLVLEYCAGGDLAKFIRAHGKISEHSAQRFLRQLSSGLLTLHRLSFIHRDLKPQNILLTEDSEGAVLKIADFGFARFLEASDMAATVCGSPLYMAPEILRHERYDAKADIWSLMVIQYELLFGEPPYSASNPMQLLAIIESGPKRISLPTTVELSEDCCRLLQGVLAKDPSDRLSPDKFFPHSYNLGQEVLTPLNVGDESSNPATEDITFIEETSPSPMNKSSSVSSEPVMVLTGLLRVFLEVHSLQSQGPIADSFAATQVGLGILLRYIAEQTIQANEEEEGEKVFVDSLGIVSKSCQFLDNALDEIIDRNTLSMVEQELKLSIELATTIQSKLSYRGFTESSQPLRWVYAFVLNMSEETIGSSSENRFLMSHSCILLCDFLLNEFSQQEASTANEQSAKDQSEVFLKSVRDRLLAL